MYQPTYSDYPGCRVTPDPAAWITNRWHAGIRTLRIWRQRHATRRTLLALERHQLEDVGITPAQLYRETAKPFWRP